MNNCLSELASILTNENTQTDKYISLLTNTDSEKPIQFSCYIDWKEEAEEIIGQLKRVVKELGYTLKLDKITLDGEDTGEALEIIGEYLAAKGYTLLYLDTGGDDYTLFVIQNKNYDRLMQLAAEAGLKFQALGVLKKQNNQVEDNPNNFIIEKKLLKGRILTEYSGSASIVAIPDGVTHIGEHAFNNCKSLVLINIPDSVVAIGQGAFNECRNLSTLNIPKSVITIESCAFVDCTKLSSVTFADGLKSIGHQAFAVCAITSLIIPGTVARLEDEVFYVCRKLKSVVIKEGVKSIESEAFRDCKKLVSVTIPKSVKTIDESAFSGCNALKSLDSRYWRFDENKKPVIGG